MDFDDFGGGPVVESDVGSVELELAEEEEGEERWIASCWLRSKDRP